MAKKTIHELAKTVPAETVRTRPVKETEEIIWNFLDVVAQTLAAGDSLTISNFGTFSAHERPARKARNPQTGETVEIPAQRVATFKATGRLREMVRDGDTTSTIRKPARD